MMNCNNTLILVIDIQERLLPALHNGAEFTAACRRLITGSRLLNLPLLLTEQYPKGLGATVADIALAAKHAPVFAKTQFSAFTDEVQAAIAAAQPEYVVLIGCEAHICMLQTVADLRAAGLAVYVPQECTASRTEINKINGLKQMCELGATIGNVESLLFQLMRDAKHPNFKEISKLIQ